MKGAGKTILSIGLIAIMMLAYVHGETASFQLSYKINKNTESLTEKSEEYRQLKFHVDQLKAPRFLESKMEEFSFDLALPEEILVVRIPSAIPSLTTTLEGSGVEPVSQRLGNFLGRWIGVAQAKTDQ